VDPSMISFLGILVFPLPRAHSLTTSASRSEMTCR
jgi:hypothetical protein